MIYSMLKEEYPDVTEFEFIEAIKSADRDIKVNRLNMSKKTTINDVLNIIATSIDVVRRCNQ